MGAFAGERLVMRTRDLRPRMRSALQPTPAPRSIPRHGLRNRVKAQSQMWVCFNVIPGMTGRPYPDCGWG